MNHGIGSRDFDVDKLRARLRKMTNKQLLEFGRNVRYLHTAEANLRQPPSGLWLTQLWEECAEWRRRLPKKT